MSFLPSSRPTLPPIRDLFPDEFSSKVGPPFNSPSLTPAQPWSDDDQITKPSPDQYPVVHSIYGPPFRYLNTELRRPSCNASFYTHRLSDKDIVSLVQPNTTSSFIASSSHPHQVLWPQNPCYVNSRHPQSISMPTYPEYVEAFEPTSVTVARHNGDASSASTHSLSFTHEVQHERRNSSASYECPYCGKMFNRPSSLKIHSNSHTGEKPFACPVQNCGRCFSVLSNMRRHARAHSSYAVSLTESASDHHPPPLSSTSSNLGLSSPMQSHHRYSTSDSSSMSRKTNSIFGQ